MLTYYSSIVCILMFVICRDGQISALYLKSVKYSQFSNQLKHLRTFSDLKASIPDNMSSMSNTDSLKSSCMRFLSTLIIAASTMTTSLSPACSVDNLSEVIPVRGYQTKDGLIYFDIVSPDESNLPTPKFGQFISFYYSLYYRDNPFSTDPDTKEKPLELIDSNFDSNAPFLQKHGIYIYNIFVPSLFTR